MAEVTLTAETGRIIGSAAARRLRAEGKHPRRRVRAGRRHPGRGRRAPRAAPRAVHRRRHNALITLDVDGTQQLTIVRDLQRDPVQRTVDPRRLPPHQPRRSHRSRGAAPPRGRSHRVHRNDGLVDHALDSLTVLAKPATSRRVHDRRRRDVDRRRDPGPRPRAARGRHDPVDPEEPVVTAEATRATIEAEEEAAGGRRRRGRSRGAEGARAEAARRRRRQRRES